MIEWRRVPWSLWAYSAVLLLVAISVEVTAHGPILAKVLLAAIMLSWLSFLLKGVRWVWIATIAICVFGLGSDLISGAVEWQGVALSLIGLLLLLLPVTRRYFSSQTVAMGA